MSKRTIRRILRLALLGVMLASLAEPVLARSLAQKKKAARSQFDTAEQMREALNGKPEKERTRKDYDRVLNAYRRVYYVAPTSSKADSSVLAVAELLAEEGRTFDDEKPLKAAIGQYEFLRKEYPGSKYRFEALFTIAEIYRQDLDDPASAKTTFEEFLKHYPRHKLAADATKALDDMEKAAKAAKAPKPKKQEKAAAKVEKPAQGKSEDKPEESKPIEDTTPAGKLPLVTRIRHWSTPDYTRVVIDLEEQVKYEAGRVPNPDRIFFDFHDTKLASELIGKSFDVGDGLLRRIRAGQYDLTSTRIVLEVEDLSEYSAFLLPNPYRLIIDIHGTQPPQSAKTAPIKETSKPAETRSETKPVEAKAAPAPAPARADTDNESDSTEIARLDGNGRRVKSTDKPTSGPTFESVAPRKETVRQTKTKNKEKEESVAVTREAQPTSSGDRSLIRALGLKIGRIVLDPGHGGHDTGTVGPHGLEEKDLVLDVTLRLGKLLESRLGADVVYTRDNDTFIPLETRTAIANKEQADLFLSIHANSSREASARGVETYYLNFTSSKDALEVAARENSVSESSIHELQDLVKKIALKEKIDESREFASDVQQSLHSGLVAKNPGLKNRGVKKAPFIVLIGANMPSILAEISFVSNPGDEKKLKTPEYRQKIAESLYRGVSKYVSGLSGVKLAAAGRSDKTGE